MDLSTGTITEYENSHGGFHGDGHTFAVVSFDAQGAGPLEAELARTTCWRPLPMSEDVAAVLYGDEGRFRMVSGTVPRAEKGYYYFFDRNSESTDPTDAGAVYGRHSVNFSVALYDSETGLLYYCEEDT